MDKTLTEKPADAAEISTPSCWDTPPGAVMVKGESGVADGRIDDAERRLARRVRAHMEEASVTITLTNNRYTMIAVRRVPTDRAYEVRLHHMFAEADPVITRALAQYIVHNDRNASRILGEFIDANGEQVTSSRKSIVRVVRGEVHDLRAIYNDVNATYFGGRITAGLTWGPRLGLPRRRASIRMGSYAVEDNLIRIHRALDRAFVPRVFVEWVMYHEMLHQVHGVKRRGGRREFHSPAFVADEKRFAQYAACRQWERAHIDRLLHY